MDQDERLSWLFLEAQRIRQEHGDTAARGFVEKECKTEEERQAIEAHLFSDDDRTIGFNPLKPAASTTFVPGTLLGEFRIVELIASTTGQADVYRAYHPRLKHVDGSPKEVAIKILREGFSDRELELFHSEAQLLVGLKHEHIISIEDHLVFDHRPYLVMEWINGETLATRIKRGRIPMREALPWAWQIARALEHAHQRSVVHRDLKPANVMIADERVKVLDFGLARGRVVDTPESPGTTRSGGSGPRDWRIEGTLPYMSPEQLAGKPPQRSSDIWSFGCVVYEMLTGQPAFSGVWGEIEHKIRNVSPDWTLLPADTPYGIRRLMELCLNRDVKARLKDIGDARLEIGIVQDREDPLRVLELERDRIKAQAAADAERWGSERDAIRAESARASQAATEARQQNEALRSRLKTMTRREWLGWSAAAVGAASAVTAMRRVAAGTQSFQTLATSHPASIALSPDGTKIVFSAVTADRTQSQLYLIDRNATDPTPIPLPGTFGAVFPFWDPESARVGFGAEGELRWIHINGGAPTTLAEVTGFLGGAWQKDTILFGTDRGPIQSIGASGGNPGPLPGLGEHQISQRFPQFLPDGRYIYYASGPSDAAGVFVDSSNHEMMPLQLLKGSAVEAMPVYTTSQHLLFIKDGALRSLKSALKESLNVDDSTLVNTRPIAIDRSSMAMALSVADDGKRLVYRAAAASSPWQFEWFTSQGNSERSVSIESDAFPVSASLSIDGRVAYSRFVQQDFQIAIRTLDNSGSDVKRREHSDLFPVWSPVGDRLAFSTTQKRPEFDVYVMNLRVNPPTFRKLPLEGPRVSIRPTDWSPDGKHVLYQIVDQEGVTLHAVNVFNVLGNTPFTVRQNASNGQFSPNGQWIAYQSHVSGEPEIYVMRFTGGEPLFGEEPRFIARGFHPRWSKTNETLFFIDPDGALTPVTLPGSAGNNAIGEPRIRPSIFKPPTGGASLTADGPPYMVSKDDRFLIVTPSATAVPLTYLQDWESA